MEKLALKEEKKQFVVIGSHQVPNDGNIRIFMLLNYIYVEPKFCFVT